MKLILYFLGKLENQESIFLVLETTIRSLKRETLLLFARYSLLGCVNEIVEVVWSNPRLSKPGYNDFSIY
jgi:hypothetical protein